MSDIVDRFCLLIGVEGIKMPWLSEQTGISSGKWNKVKTRQNAMKASEVEALAKVWPEYAYWLTTGEELPQAGQISPMTKKAHELSKTAPKAG